jgi:hypothetical protein
VTPELQRRLAEFVDRRTEMSRFCAMLDGNDKLITVIWGEGGLGKSSLLARMVHETAQRGLRKAEVVWTNTRKHDYLGVMRKIRDDLGVEAFKPFTDLVNFFTVPQYTLKIVAPGPISVAHQAQISNSTVGDIAGVIIKDSMIVIPRSDLGVPETERMLQLTTRFIECLHACCAQGPVVLFFDTVEKMSVETHDWLWGELLAAVQDGRLPGVRCVLCGQTPPELEREMSRIVELAELHPLALDDVVEYLGRRGVKESDREVAAKFLLLSTKGKPLEVATMVDAYLQSSPRQGSGA